MRHCSYALCASFVFFWNIALDIFLKILKDKVMHQSDLFSLEELNINHYLRGYSYFAIMTASIGVIPGQEMQAWT